MTKFEIGYGSKIERSNEEVIKTSLVGYESLSRAEEEAQALRDYASALEKQPLRAVSLVSSEVIEAEDGWHIQHTYPLIEGPSFNQAPDQERHAGVASVISQIAIMDSIGNENTLFVPVDSKSANFHIDENGPVLTDLYPALIRNEDGSFPMSRFRHNQRRSTLWPYAMGTKSGAITKLLFTAATRGDDSSRLATLKKGTPDWCYDVLPTTLPVDVKRHVHFQLDNRFAPYIGRVAIDRIIEKISTKI